MKTLCDAVADGKVHAKAMLEINKARVILLGLQWADLDAKAAAKKKGKGKKKVCLLGGSEHPQQGGSSCFPSCCLIVIFHECHCAHIDDSCHIHLQADMPYHMSGCPALVMHLHCFVLQ